MMRSLWSAATGMSGQEANLAIISNNLSNVNTTGFKKSRANFEDLVYHTIIEPGASVSGGTGIPTGVQIGHGARLNATQKIFTQGEFQETGNPLDLIIQGEGFFEILLPDGRSAYTRDGSFKKDAYGVLVTSNGYMLQPEIVIPEEAVSISVSADGVVSVIIPGDSEPMEVGYLELVRFSNPSGLKAEGDNLMVATGASGDPFYGEPGWYGFGTIGQGYLEMSNVKVVEEMVNMIISQRAYEVNSKVVKASDDMLEMANNLRR